METTETHLDQKFSILLKGSFVFCSKHFLWYCKCIGSYTSKMQGMGKLLFLRLRKDQHVIGKLLNYTEPLFMLQT